MEDVFDAANRLYCEQMSMRGHSLSVSHADVNLRCVCAATYRVLGGTFGSQNADHSPYGRAVESQGNDPTSMWAGTPRRLPAISVLN